VIEYIAAGFLLVERSIVIKNKIPVGYLAFLIFCLTCSGCGLFRLPQHAAVAISDNISPRSCSETIYSNILWSKDNKKLYVIAQTIQGQTKTYSYAHSEIDPALNNFMLGVPGLVEGAIEPRVDSYEKCASNKPSFCQVYSIDLTNDAFTLTPSFSFFLDAGDELVSTCMFWSSDEDICDDKGHCMNIRTWVYQAPPPNLTFKRVMDSATTYWVGYDDHQRERKRLLVVEHDNTSVRLNQAKFSGVPYFANLTSRFDFHSAETEYRETYNFELRKFAFMASQPRSHYIGIVDADGKNLKYVKVE